MPSKNLRYCPAFPNSIALRREIAKASRSKLPLCVHALTAGAEAGGKGNKQGIRRTESDKGREGDRGSKTGTERRAGEETEWHKG